MTKHTPGPWVVYEATDRDGHKRRGTRVYASDGGEVAVATRADPKHRHRAEANATLIAAAPELLAALAYLADASETFAGSDPEMPSHCESERTFDDALAKARAALAKAGVTP